MKNFNDSIGNRTHDHPSYCAGPQLVLIFSCYFYLSIEMKHTYTCVVERNVVLLQAIHNFNPLKPNDPYSGRTAPLTSKRCFLYIYSTNIGTEYFKHGIYSPFFPLQNAVCFIILAYLVSVLFTFYVQDVLKLKK